MIMLIYIYSRTRILNAFLSQLKAACADIAHSDKTAIRSMLLRQIVSYSFFFLFILSSCMSKFYQFF